MSFFNSKEEVIDIELTQHGKKLLSKGKFDPKYYAFFDDDIIYNSECYGVTENQNNIQERIINQVPYLKSQARFISSDINQSDLNYNNFLGIPLTYYEDTEERVSSFNIFFHNNSIEKVVTNSEYLYNKFCNESVPQIYLKPQYVNIIIDKGFTSHEVNTEETITHKIAEDGTFVRTIADSIQFDIYENNVQNISLLDEFYVEIHKIIDNKEKKLKFFHRPVMTAIIENDILIGTLPPDQGIVDVSSQQIQENIEDGERVEYYFNVSLDVISEEFSTERLFIYDDSVGIAPKGDNC